MPPWPPLWYWQESVLLTLAGATLEELLASVAERCEVHQSLSSSYPNCVTFKQNISEICREKWTTPKHCLVKMTIEIQFFSSSASFLGQNPLKGEGPLGSRWWANHPADGLMAIPKLTTSTWAHFWQEQKYANVCFWGLDVTPPQASDLHTKSLTASPSAYSSFICPPCGAQAHASVAERTAEGHNETDQRRRRNQAANCHLGPWTSRSDPFDRCKHPFALLSGQSAWQFYTSYIGVDGMLPLFISELPNREDHVQRIPAHWSSQPWSSRENLLAQLGHDSCVVDCRCSGENSSPLG